MQCVSCVHIGVIMHAIMYCTTYIGKDGSLQSSGKGVTHDIVMQLTEGYQGKNHHLYVDNFYTSPTLFTSLWNASTGACGTLRCNRAGTPGIIKKPPKMSKGDIITHRNGQLFFLKWKDKREVTVCTTIHDDSLVTKRRRTSSVPGGFEEISKPVAVEEYNHFMGGVDKMDQLLSYYGFSRRTFKWWRKAFFNLFDMAIINAYILYTLSAQDNRKLSHLHFRIELAKQLLHEASHPVQSSSSQLLTSHSSQASLSRAARLTERHFPDKVSARSNGTPGQRDCAVCSGTRGRRRKTTTYCCKQCGVGLCIVPCFELYHTKVDPARYLPEAH